MADCAPWPARYAQISASVTELLVGLVTADLSNLAESSELCIGANADMTEFT